MTQSGNDKTPPNPPTDKSHNENKRVFQIKFWGSKSDVDSLEHVLKNKGVRYHVQHDPSRGWGLVAYKIDKRLIRLLEPDLFQHRSAATTWFTVTYEDSHSTFDVLSDPKEHFKGYVERPKDYIFVRYDDVIPGCLECLCNARQLAEVALSNKKTTRISIMLSSYAIEELGKSALLLREAARSLKKKLHVAIVKEFRSHHTKLRIIINELIGKRESPNGHTILHKPGLLHDLIEKSRISSPFFRENREDFFNIKNPHLWMFLDGLGDFGSLEREHCIYVDYDSTNHQWRKPTTQHDEIMCERAAKLVLMMVELYDKPLRKLSSFPSDKMKLSDLLKQ